MFSSLPGDVLLPPPCLHLVHPLSADGRNAQAGVMFLHLEHMNNEKSWFQQKITWKRTRIRVGFRKKLGSILTLTDSK